jgi:hypothetical protein
LPLIFSAPVKNECLRLINAYAEELIRMITNKYTPEEICKEIREDKRN